MKTPLPGRDATKTSGPVRLKLSTYERQAILNPGQRAGEVAVPPCALWPKKFHIILLWVYCICIFECCVNSYSRPSPNQKQKAPSPSPRQDWQGPEVSLPWGNSTMKIQDFWNPGLQGAGDGGLQLVPAEHECAVQCRHCRNPRGSLKEKWVAVLKHLRGVPRRQGFSFTVLQSFGSLGSRELLFSKAFESSSEPEVVSTRCKNLAEPKMPAWKGNSSAPTFSVHSLLA